MARMSDLAFDADLIARLTEGPTEPTICVECRRPTQRPPICTGCVETILQNRVNS